MSFRYTYDGELYAKRTLAYQMAEKEKKGTKKLDTQKKYDRMVFHQ